MFHLFLSVLSLYFHPQSPPTYNLSSALSINNGFFFFPLTQFAHIVFFYISARPFVYNK